MKNNIINSLQTNEALISQQPIIPFCQGCQKPIKTVQENQRWLNEVFSNIKTQLPIQKQEPVMVFTANQDKPAAWKIVHEVWVDEKGFFCRFCVPVRNHPKYRKFYLFDYRFFYLDKKWEQHSQAYMRRIKEHEQNRPSNKI